MPFPDKLDQSIFSFLSALDISGPLMNFSEKQKVLQDFISLMVKRKSKELLHINLREQFFHNLTSYPNSYGTESNILNDECDSGKLVVKNAAIINNDDLCNSHDQKSYTPVIETMASRASLFHQAVSEMLLPQDIKHLADAVLSFTLISHSQERLYLHEKAISPLTEYARQIVNKTPFFVNESNEISVNNIKDIDVEEEDVLSENSMNTDLTYYILTRAGLKNIELALK